MDDKIRHVLTEARMVLPGAQALLGFQLAVTLMESFSDLPDGARWLHLGAIGLTALTVMLLMMPAAYHRIAEEGENTTRFYRFASRLVLSAMVPLALALGAELAVVYLRVGDEWAWAALLGAVAVTMLLGSWFGVPLFVRIARLRRARTMAAPAS